jgi:hypothetical protein
MLTLLQTAVLVGGEHGWVAAKQSHQKIGSVQRVHKIGMTFTVMDGKYYESFDAIDCHGKV